MNTLLTASRTKLLPSRRAFLSTQSAPAMDKLRTVLEDYRQQHYRQETPTRFKKELVAAACKSAEKDHVGPEDFEHVLSNIGVINLLNKGDLNSIFQQIGNSTGKVSASQLYKML